MLENSTYILHLIGKKHLPKFFRLGYLLSMPLQSATLCSALVGVDCNSNLFYYSSPYCPMYVSYLYEVLVLGILYCFCQFIKPPHILVFCDHPRDAYSYSVTLRQTFEEHSCIIKYFHPSLMYNKSFYLFVKQMLVKFKNHPVATYGPSSGV